MTEGSAPGLALVTGASGFVGSHLVEALVAAGWRVRALARPTSSRRWLPARPEVEVALGDVTEPATLAAAIAGVDRVDHCAGLVAALRAEAYTRVNVEGTRHLLDACAARPGSPPRVVLVSSQAAVGPNPTAAPLDEEAPCRPVASYGASKAAAEALAATYADRLPVTVVRPPAVYGPRDPGTLEFFRLIARGWLPDAGRRDPTLSIVHVRDLVRGIVAAGDAPRAIGRTYFLAAAEPVRWSALMAAIHVALGARRVWRIPFNRPVLWLAAVAQEVAARVTGRVPPLTRERLPEFLAPAWVCSPARAAAELGWRAEVALPAGLAETVAWYREAGWLPAAG